MTGKILIAMLTGTGTLLDFFKIYNKTSGHRY